MTRRSVKRAVTLYPEQWAIVDRIALADAEATGDRPNVSLALRRIITEYDRPNRRPHDTDEFYPQEEPQ